MVNDDEKCKDARKKDDRFFYSDYDNMGNESEWDKRTEFIRDRDRIVYSKAFRRLQHKAQVYSPGKGDHYRTRLTHTLEVTQIARGLARNLELNETLTEAIALGHDIGHTPFGHAGEEVLDDIMRGKEDLGGKIKYKIDYGGFKHNLNGLNILEFVEDKYKKESGLNLTWQVLDGILKHTSIIKEDKKWDWKRFVKEPDFYPFLSECYHYNNEFDEKTRKKINTPLTLEGQVVNIADEIAQREHDLDDSYRNWIKSEYDRSMFINIQKIFEEIKDELKESNDYNMDSYKIFKKYDDKISKNLDIVLEDFELSESDLNFYWKDIIRNLIAYFKEDVSKNSKINEDIVVEKTHKIKNLNCEYLDHKIICVNKEIISFSDVGGIVNKKIESFINNRLIHSYEVARFDGKGKFIIKQLFKAYYENPRQMSEKCLKKLEKLINSNIEKFHLNLEFNDYSVFNVCFVSEGMKKINYFHFNSIIDMLKLNDFQFKLADFVCSYKIELNENCPKLENDEKESENYYTKIILPNGGDEKIASEIIFKNIIYFDYERENVNVLKDNIIKSFKMESFHDIVNKTFNDVFSIDEFSEEKIKYFKFHLENHYAFLKVICDYISEMTDNYAELEYQRLYV